MPGEEAKTPQEQIKEGIWRIALQTVVILVAIVFGVFIGYQLWGDAPDLRLKVVALDQQILELKNEREAQDKMRVMTERARDEAQKRRDKCFEQKGELQKQIAELRKQLGE